jgi:hypothetical protein
MKCEKQYELKTMSGTTILCKDVVLSCPYFENLYHVIKVCDTDCYGICNKSGKS